MSFTEISKTVIAIFLSVTLCLPAVPVSAKTEVTGFDVETATITYENEKDTILWFETSVSEEIREQILDYYEEIPSGILILFEKYDSKIYISDSVSFEKDQYQVKAITETAAVSYSRLTNKITKMEEAPYIVMSASDSENLDSIIHEAGHMFDNVAMLEDGVFLSEQYAVSSLEEWEEIYEKEADSFSQIDSLSQYNVCISAKEGFAEAFRLYIVKPDELKSCAEETFAFVENIIEKYNPIEETLEYFDAEDYAERYPKIAAALDYDRNRMYSYYINWGKSLGQKATFKVNS